MLSITCKYTVMEHKFTVVPICSMKSYRTYRGVDIQCHWFLISVVRGGQCSAALHCHLLPVE